MLKRAECDVFRLKRILWFERAVRIAVEISPLVFVEKDMMRGGGVVEG